MFWAMEKKLNVIIAQRHSMGEFPNSSIINLVLHCHKEKDESCGWAYGSINQEKWLNNIEKVE